jgi:hypothetical protein
MSRTQDSSWTSTGPAEVFEIAVNPKNPQEVLCGSLYSGIFRSEDQGATWIYSGEGLPIIFYGQVMDIVYDPVDPTVLTAVSRQ